MNLLVIVVSSMVCFFGVSYQHTSFNLYETQPVEQTQFGCGTPPEICTENKYRSFDGSCNNLEHPEWGMEQTPYSRMLKANYRDGINIPVLSKSGRPLLNAHTISKNIYPDLPIFQDPKNTIVTMEYGQFISHDISLFAQGWPKERCCTIYGEVMHDPGTNPQSCMPIIFPYHDIDQSTLRCIDFNRSITTLDRGCIRKNEAVDQISVVTSYIDLSQVYGNNMQYNQMLRNHSGGRFKVSAGEGKEWPSHADPSKSAFMCTFKTKAYPCYIAGGNRANQNPQIAVLQIAWLREHNRLADGLALLNPEWDDETIFQEARRIAIAIHQQISYYEWIPVYIGDKLAKKYKLVYDTTDYANDYSSITNPTALNEFSTAAFRNFHVAIAGNIELVGENRNIQGNLTLGDHYRGNYCLEENDTYDKLIRGFTSQHQRLVKTHHTKEFTERLFQLDFPFLNDGKAVDIQRSRDHGLPTYNQMRHHCNQPVANKFSDLFNYMSREDATKLATLYESPHDIELTVGGSLETHVEGSLAGPTFLCIVKQQFQHIRKGDRFWFENSGINSNYPFTIDQLTEIRKVRISRILCDNGNNILYMQKRGFERISIQNPLVSCDDLPKLNLSLWKAE